MKHAAATMCHMDPASIRAYAARDWGANATAKRAYWAGRYQREGLRATVEASRALLAAIRHVRPDYPTENERRADLAGHVRLQMLLDRAAHAFTRR